MRSLFTLLAAVTGALAADSTKLPAPASTADFMRDIEPIFRSRCQSCHGPQLQSSGLRLDSADGALKGGYSGAVIQPGRSAESRLIHVVAGADERIVMPPVGKRLTPQEVGLIRAWIDQGAKWPALPGQAPAAAPGKQTHWSFQQVRKPELPEIRNRSWPRNPIDRFVLARLEQAGIEPSSEAPKTTLARRLFMDLTGLPPSPADVTAFVMDNRPDAYEKLVDRLLDSPHYGEKGARDWLETAQYADSPRYRQWVIEALNRDMPFDQFTIEQIAGDLLANATPAQKIATGFFRNSGASQTEAIARTCRVSKVWLGLTAECAQCHDHKYDPIKQADFYGFLAFFNNLENQSINAPLPGEMGPYLEAISEHRNGLEKSHGPYPVLSQAQIIAERSDYRPPSVGVRAEIPAFLPPLTAGAAPNRLALARWLVAADNPLTPRVTVNRMWQTFFGKGLVNTTDDFGARSEKPSDPELLDWLAAQFRDSGWRVKAMHRLIVTSAAYRQLSEARPDIEERDPNHVLIARQSRWRLSTDLAHDATLSVADLLDPAIGAWSDLSNERDHYRRRMYTIHFNLQDAGGLACSRNQPRFRIQASALPDEPTLLESGQALAARVLREMPTAAFVDRLRYLYLICFSRPPNAREWDWLSRYYRQRTAILQKDTKLAKTLFPGEVEGHTRVETAAWVAITKTLLNLEEFTTRE